MKGFWRVQRTLTFNGRLRAHAICLLRPKYWDTTTILVVQGLTLRDNWTIYSDLHIASVVGIRASRRVQISTCGVIEGSSQGLGDNLFGLNFVGNISLVIDTTFQITSAGVMA
jgi:hypothetical protein